MKSLPAAPRDLASDFSLASLRPGRRSSPAIGARWLPSELRRLTCATGRSSPFSQAGEVRCQRRPRRLQLAHVCPNGCDPAGQGRHRRSIHCEGPEEGSANRRVLVDVLGVTYGEGRLAIAGADKERKPADSWIDRDERDRTRRRCGAKATSLVQACVLKYTELPFSRPPAVRGRCWHRPAQGPRRPPRLQEIFSRLRSRARRVSACFGDSGEVLRRLGPTVIEDLHEPSQERLQHHAAAAGVEVRSTAPTWAEGMA